jgi:hypothetical protein
MLPNETADSKREHRSDTLGSLRSSRSRLVGLVQRQPSYKYSELSQKGMKIEMDRDAKTGKHHHHHHQKEELPVANPPSPPHTKG